MLVGDQERTTSPWQKNRHVKERSSRSRYPTDTPEPELSCPVVGSSTEADRVSDEAKYCEYLQLVERNMLPPPSRLQPESKVAMYDLLRDLGTLCSECNIEWWVTNNTWMALERGHGGIPPWDTVVTAAMPTTSFKQFQTQEIVDYYRRKFNWNSREKSHFGCKIFKKGGCTEAGKKEFPHLDIFVVEEGGIFPQPYAKFHMTKRKDGTELWASHVHPTADDLRPLRMLRCADFTVPVPHKATALNAHYPDFRAQVVTGSYNHLTRTYVKKTDIKTYPIPVPCNRLALMPYRLTTASSASASIPASAVAVTSTAHSVSSVSSGASSVAGDAQRADSAVKNRRLQYPYYFPFINLHIYLYPHS